jgi:broad specificity phosphatase PhoE
MLIYLIRHGLTDACFSEDKSAKNVYLNKEGKNQIINSAKKISSISRIITSPTLRTIESSEIIRSIVNPNIEIQTDYRLLNKVNEGQTYVSNLKTFLDEIKKYNDTLLLVTHGRIIKMIYSIIVHDTINVDFIDELEMDYGSISIIEYTGEKYNMLHYNSLDKDYTLI